MSHFIVNSVYLHVFVYGIMCLCNIEAILHINDLIMTRQIDSMYDMRVLMRAMLEILVVSFLKLSCKAHQKCFNLIAAIMYRLKTLITKYVPLPCFFFSQLQDGLGTSLLCSFYSDFIYSKVQCLIEVLILKSKLYTVLYSTSKWRRIHF